MNDYSEIQAIKDAKLFLRHYVYNNEFVFNFMEILKSINSSHLMTFSLEDTNIDNYQIKVRLYKDTNMSIEKYREDIGIALSCALNNPEVNETIRMMSFAIDDNALKKIYDAVNSRAHIVYLYSALFITTDPKEDVVLIQL